MKIKRVFALFIVFLNCKINANQGQGLEDYFYNISNEDKKDIEVLFTSLFKIQPFAYTVYFDKPMSFSEISLNSNPYSSPLESLSYLFFEDELKFIMFPYAPSKRAYRKGWQTLEKYQKFFNHEKFLFIYRKFNGYGKIFLINRKKFKEIAMKHIHLFKKILGENFSPELLLKQIEQPNADIKELLNHNQTLLGILLGFGKHNAQLFELREQLYAKLDSLDYLKDYRKGFEIQQKIDQLWETLQCRNEYYKYDSITVSNLVAYACDRDHPESIELDEKYEKQGAEINKILNEERWVENILIELSR
jgi:hypothetical protein